MMKLILILLALTLAACDGEKQPLVHWNAHSAAQAELAKLKRELLKLQIELAEAKAHRADPSAVERLQINRYYRLEKARLDALSICNDPDRYYRLMEKHAHILPDCEFVTEQPPL